MLLSLRSNSQIQRYIYKIVIVYIQAVFITNYVTTLICLYLYEYLLLLDILYIIKNKLISTSLIVWICSAVYKISANKTFTVTNSLISWLFVVAFVYSIYI